jgi:hypothetical protein
MSPAMAIFVFAPTAAIDGPTLPATALPALAALFPSAFSFSPLLPAVAPAPSSASLPSWSSWSWSSSLPPPPPSLSISPSSAATTFRWDIRPSARALLLRCASLVS